MDLLDFARGPAMHLAIVIMVAGFFWRAADFTMRPGEPDLYWARKAFHVPNQRWQFDSYAMHAGLLLVLFGFAPHILFIRALIGIEWPGIPTAIVLFAATISIVAMLAVLAHRLMDPKRGVFSAFDDYFTWSTVFLAMVTGMVAYPHLGGTSVMGPDAMLLTAHLFAVELLMIWLPFGKLVHVAFMPILRAAVTLRHLVYR